MGYYNSLYICVIGAFQQEVSGLKAELQALTDAKVACERDASAVVEEKAARLAETMDRMRSLEAAAEESKEAIAALELRARCWRFTMVFFFSGFLCVWFFVWVLIGVFSCEILFFWCVPCAFPVVFMCDMLSRARVL